MKTVSRRRAMTLASSLAAAPLLNSIDSLAQPGAPTTVFDIANFTAPSPDHDAAFAKAVAAISEAAAEANKAGRPAPHIVLNLDKNAIYRIKRPIVVKQLSGIEIHGNGAQLINTARADIADFRCEPRHYSRSYDRLRSNPFHTRNHRQF